MGLMGINMSTSTFSQDTKPRNPVWSQSFATWKQTTLMTSQAMLRHHILLKSFWSAACQSAAQLKAACPSLANDRRDPYLRKDKEWNRPLSSAGATIDFMPLKCIFMILYAVFLKQTPPHFFQTRCSRELGSSTGWDVKKHQFVGHSQEISKYTNNLSASTVQNQRKHRPFLKVRHHQCINKSPKAQNPGNKCKDWWIDDAMMVIQDISLKHSCRPFPKPTSPAWSKGPAFLLRAMHGP